MTDQEILIKLKKLKIYLDIDYKESQCLANLSDYMYLLGRSSVADDIQRIIKDIKRDMEQYEEGLVEQYYGS